MLVHNTIVNVIGFWFLIGVCVFIINSVLKEGNEYE